jgi:hypothetical protein
MVPRMNLVRILIKFNYALGIYGIRERGQATSVVGKNIGILEICKIGWAHVKVHIVVIKGILFKREDKQQE